MNWQEKPNPGECWIDSECGKYRIVKFKGAAYPWLLFDIKALGNGHKILIGSFQKLRDAKEAANGRT